MREKTIAEKVLKFFKSRGVRGWVRGFFRGENHPNKAKLCYCLAGGAAAVTPDGFFPGGCISPASREAQEQLARELGFDSSGCMVEWNDAKHRRFADVIARLERAVKAQRAERRAIAKVQAQATL